MDSKKRVVIGVSGASGSLLGLECLKCLREAGAESHLVMSRGAEITAKQELGMDFDEFASYADVVYDNRNIGASIASGTFPIDGMVVAPCSMKTLAGIACGYSDNLLLRAASPGAYGSRDAVFSHSYRQHGKALPRVRRHDHAADAYVL